MDFKTSEIGSRESKSPETTEVGSTGVPFGNADKVAVKLQCSLHAGLEQFNNATQW